MFFCNRHCALWVAAAICGFCVLMAGWSYDAHALWLVDRNCRINLFNEARPDCPHKGQRVASIIATKEDFIGGGSCSLRLPSFALHISFQSRLLITGVLCVACRELSLDFWNQTDELTEKSERTQQQNEGNRRATCTPLRAHEVL